MATQIYGPGALRTFFDCVLTLTERKVPLVFGGRSPCTDGKSVYIPSRGLLDAVEFRKTCGIILHEVAHIWFGSNAYLERLLAKFDMVERDRARLCFNAVIDVADENRMGLRTARAKVLFDELSLSVLERMQTSGMIPVRPPGSCDSLETFIAVAMFLAQSAARSETRKRLHGWRSLPGVTKAFRILSRAIERRSTDDFSPIRTDREWSRIGRLTRELVDLVQEIFPPSRGLGEGLKASYQDETPTDVYGKFIQPIRTRIILDGYRNERDGSAEEDSEWEDEVAALLGAGVEGDDDDEDLDDDDDEPLDWFSSSALPVAPWFAEKVDFDEELYHEVRPAFRSSVRKLVLGVSSTQENGQLQGSRLGQLHRLHTDGRVFRRMTYEESTEAAVCLLVDHSCSMKDLLRVFLPVGLAMAEAFEDVPEVSVSVIRFGSDVERLDSPGEFRDGQLMGGTGTHLALREARIWLASRESSRKLVVLFTDGLPDEAEETRREAIELKRLGAYLLVGTLGSGLSQCAVALPHSVLFSVDTERVASSLHTAVSRLVSILERGL